MKKITIKNVYLNISTGQCRNVSKGIIKDEFFRFDYFALYNISFIYSTEVSRLIEKERDGEVCVCVWGEGD